PTAQRRPRRRRPSPRSPLGCTQTARRPTATPSPTARGASAACWAPSPARTRRRPRRPATVARTPRPGSSASSGGRRGHTRAPAGARIPAPSLFGLNTGTFDPSYAHYVRDLPTARSLGARWVHFTGSLVKNRRGRPDFSLLDSQVVAARRLGLGVLISLGGAPQACSVRPRPSDLSSCPPRSARELRAYD